MNADTDPDPQSRHFVKFRLATLKLKNKIIRV